MPVYRGPGGAGDATNDATVTAVQAAATSAATSATNAANSATAAATSASGASTSATNAANSATSSAGSATSSANSATASAGYATNSSLSADDSAASAVEAAGYASDAFDYSVAASVSSGTASDYADSAIAASASAYAHELAAAASASDAADSYADTLAIFGDATDVADAVAAAQLAESNASDSADAAAASAVTAAGSASSAATQAVNAAASAATADAEATSAGASAVDAAEYAADASDYADEAQGYAGDALDAYQNTLAVYNDLETVEAAVANSLANRDAAAASATAASNSASTATTQAGLATTQATNAAASAAAASAVALGNEPVRHSVRPSLLLDFANTKTLDPRITFSRASTGTYYDGKTTAKAEENLLPRSQEFDNVVWTKGNTTVTANTIAAPDETSTADSLLETATTGLHYIGNITNVVAITTGTSYTVSTYVKQLNNQYFQLTFGSGAFGTAQYATFDLIAGTVATASVGTATITSVGSGWYRCTFTATATSTANDTCYFGCTNSSTGRLPSYAGNTANGVYLWGAQLEQRSSVTAYTATTTAPITNYIPALQTATSGTARFDHNPLTSESLGLLIEEQRTNLLKSSETFDNGVNWSVLRADRTPNTIISPSGTLTGYKLVETASTGTHEVYQGITATAASHTGTMYFKAGERTKAWMYLAASGSIYSGIFDLVAGTVGSVSASATATITAVGNGWYRCSITATLTATTWYLGFAPVTGTSTTSYAGDGYSGIYIWGAQLEAGSFATSYIPTVASQVTRSADSASILNTNFTNLYNYAEGTLYGELTAFGTNFIVQLDDGTNNNRLFAGIGQPLNQTVIANGATQASISLGNISANTSAKVSLAVKSNDFVASLNGGAVGTDTSGVLPVVDRLRIGSNATPSYSSGLVKKIAYYPKKLTNAELQGLTTV